MVFKLNVLWIYKKNVFYHFALARLGRDKNFWTDPACMPRCAVATKMSPIIADQNVNLWNGFGSMLKQDTQNILMDWTLQYLMDVWQREAERNYECIQTSNVISNQVCLEEIIKTSYN